MTIFHLRPHLSFHCPTNENEQIANKGYSRMSKDDETQWLSLMQTFHSTVKMRYNTGKLLMVLSRPVDTSKLLENEERTVKRAPADTLEKLKQSTGDRLL